MASDSRVGAREAFARLVPHAGRRLLLASDFDGTIARLSPDAWAAAIIPAAQRALRRLAASPRVHVALISGRTVADLAARARVGGISYHGDHGSEHASPPRGFRISAVRVERDTPDPASLAMAARLKREVPRAVDEAWLVLEDKGSALTFHFRAAPDIDAARVRVADAVDAVDPHRTLARWGSRRAHELRPADAATKQHTLGWLIATYRPAVAVMLGDDRHDAGAFDQLRAARRAGRLEGLAIAVAGHADVTQDVAAHADLVLRDPDEAARFLGLVARAWTGASPRRDRA